jgi:hypothetical protein
VSPRTRKALPIIEPIVPVNGTSLLSQVAESLCSRRNARAPECKAVQSSAQVLSTQHPLQTALELRCYIPRGLSGLGQEIRPIRAHPE